MKQVCEDAEKLDLKLAPFLEIKHLSPSHYEMNVGPPGAVFDHSVASAIRLPVEERKCQKKL